MNSKEDLRLFIKIAKTTIKNFESVVGWEKLEKKGEENELVKCPVNEHHRISKKCFDIHVRKCKWRKLGYSYDEIKEIIEDEDSNFGGQCYNVDEIIAKVAPGTSLLRTHERYVSTLTNDERIKVFDMIREEINEGKGNIATDPTLYDDLQKQISENMSDVKKSEVEMMKEQRDHKRRRQTYRAKNVHITRRSQTEIIRGLLAVHMEHLHNTWNPNSKSPDRESVVNQIESATKPEASMKRDFESRERSLRREESNKEKSEARYHGNFSHKSSSRKRDFRDSRERHHEKSREYDRESSKTGYRDYSRERTSHKRSRHDHGEEEKKKKKETKKEKSPSPSKSHSKKHKKHSKSKKHKSRDYNVD